jgi:hypothetical protein
LCSHGCSWFNKGLSKKATKIGFSLILPMIQPENKYFSKKYIFRFRLIGKKNLVKAITPRSLFGLLLKCLSIVLWARDQAPYVYEICF